jgi:hypothetical protein
MRWKVTLTQKIYRPLPGAWQSAMIKMEAILSINPVNIPNGAITYLNFTLPGLAKC